MIGLLGQLFFTFFFIGLFNFGGGGAMLSLIQGQVVTAHSWITQEMFTDIVAISQTTPGPIGINCATYVGYEVMNSAGFGPWAGVLGSVLATFANTPNNSQSETCFISTKLHIFIDYLHAKSPAKYRN